MLPLSILITCLVGFCAITVISKEFSYAEKIGSSFLLGIGFQVIGMILLDLVGITINLSSIYSVSILFIIATLAYTLVVKKTSVKEIFIPKPIGLPSNWQKVNIPWLVIAGFATFIWWAVVKKCLFFPPFEFDTIAGYDLMAKVLSNEGTFNNSLFYSNGKSIANTAHRMVYPPLVSASFGYAYMSGAVLSKIMSTMFHTSGLILLYGLARQLKLTSLNAIVIILGVLLIPELTAHSSLSQTNMPQAMYIASGLIALLIWFKNREEQQRYFWLSLLLLSINTLCRPENIIFAFLAGVVVFVDWVEHRTKRNFVRMVIYAVVLLAPTILWSLFISINNMQPDMEASPGLLLSYDAEKFASWWGYVWGGNKEVPSGVARSKNYYALTMHLYLIMTLISSLYIAFQYRKAKLANQNQTAYALLSEQLFWLWIGLGGFVLYSFIFYLIDYNWDSLRNVLMYSYKRGMFGLMIIFTFFTFSNILSRKLFEVINHFMYGKEKKTN
jgi:hypothetical protein